MSSLPFLAAIVCVGIILFWYVRDEAVRGGRGNSGLLNIGDGSRDKPKQKHPNWKSDKGKHPWRPGR